LGEYDDLPAYLERKRQRKQRRRRFMATIDFFGAFCAWEVFILAAYMVELLMPAIITTVLMKPDLYGLVVSNGSCLSVAFAPQSCFALVIGGGILLVLMAQSLSRPPRNHSNGSIRRAV
jgi:hypothetical protein